MKKILDNKLIFFIPFLIIMIISFLDMYNAKYLSSLYNHNLIKQIIWYGIGIFIFIISKCINTKNIFKYSFILYIISITLLIYVLMFGKVINGAKAWITIKGLSFQPSELTKLSLAIMLSDLAGKFKSTGIKSEFIFLLKVAILILIPSVLVFLEPDSGAIIFFLVITLAILMFSDIHKFWFTIVFILIALFIGGFILLYLYNKDLLISLIGTSFFYRVERLITFKTMSSYQLENALVAMGSSSLLGTGLGKVSLYIPEAPTDFIFAFSISNFGYLCGFIILSCYFLMDLFLINKIINMKKNTLKYILISFTSIFLFGQIINIGMNLGLLPIIGIPLPFLSYGGSTLIIYFTFLSKVNMEVFDSWKSIENFFKHYI